MKFGTFVPQGWRMDLVEIADPIEQYEAMTRVALTAEELNFDSIWVYDHFHTVPTPEIETTFEAWTISAGLARDTSRVRIGQMVTCNGYRNPAMLAKMASTLDVMSKGRAICGLGAGWYEHEWLAYGYGFPETRDRMRSFRESVEICVRMWTDEKATFKGEYHHIDGAINEPKGVQTPRLPLWLGGGGEKVTLKLVAQHANGCNFGGGDIELVRQKMAVLRQHCETQERDIETITRSTSLNLYLLEDGEDAEKGTAQVRGETSYEEFAKNYTVGTTSYVRELIEGLQAEGINYIVVYLPRAAYDDSQMRRFASEVMSHFA